MPCLPRDVLNLTRRELGSVEVRGSKVVVMAMPLDRAFGGRNVKKRRAGLAQVEKGLNLAVTSVMNLVIILTAVAQRARDNAAAIVSCR